MSEARLPREAPARVFGPLGTMAGKRGRLPCKLTTSDNLRGNQSYFPWIALSFISRQINLVRVGDSTAATAGPFFAVSVVCARGNAFLPCSCAFLELVLFLPSAKAACCGGETTGHEDRQGLVDPQLGLLHIRVPGPWGHVFREP